MTSAPKCQRDLIFTNEQTLAVGDFVNLLKGGMGNSISTGFGPVRCTLQCYSLGALDKKSMARRFLFFA